MRLRRRSECNSYMSGEDLILQGLDWILLAQDRDYYRDIMSTVVHLLVPYNGGSLSR
jgi:hypothetical protein